MCYSRIKILLLLSAIPLLLQAQDKIRSGVFGNGSTATSNESYQLQGTLGQPLTGQGTSNSNSIQSGFWAQVKDIVTSINRLPAEEEGVPKEFQLKQNYPNPFNPSTTIVFAIPQTADVTIKLFDLHGRKVAILADEKFKPGKYNIVFETTELATGMYFYQISAKTKDSGERFIQTRKLTLLK